MLTFLMLVSVAVTVKLSSLSALVMLSVSFDLNSEMTGAVLSMVMVMVWLVFSPSPIVALSIRVQLPSATQPRLDGVEVNHQILFEDCVVQVNQKRSCLYCSHYSRKVYCICRSCDVLGCVGV